MNMNPAIASSSEANAELSTALVNGTVEVVKAYLQSNTIPSADLPEFIRSVHRVMLETAGAAGAVLGEVPSIHAAGEYAVQMESGETAAEPYKWAHIPREPIIPVEESIKDNVLVCLIDGVEKQMLKRHVRAKYGMEWEDYLAHFGLGKDYPSTAPGYSALKREEAIRQGLGSTIDKTPKALRESKVRTRRVPMALAA